MPGVISRKTRSAARGTKNPPATSSIASFTKISKLQTLGKDVASEKKAAAGTIFGRTSNIEIVLTSKKRKIEDEVDSTPKKQRREPEARPIVTATPVSRKKKTVSFNLPEDAAPVKPTPKRAAPVSTPSRKRSYQAGEDDDSPTQTSSLLERLRIQSPIQKKRTKTVALPAQNDFDLPQELVDLLDMQTAFLKSLSMQYAHNGTNSPIDLRSLYPSVTRAWGKRQVVLLDIQRLLGILNWTPAKTAPEAAFILSDYGRSKICIDFSPSLPAGPIREAKLNMDFESNLRTLWMSSNNKNVTLFLGTLPKASVKKCESLLKAAIPKQTTLDSLKAGIQARKEAEKAAKEEAAKKIERQAVKAGGTKMTLLERIKMKEEELKSMPEGPSAQQLQRRAALHRAEDVAAVIGMLCKASGGGQARVSFTMQQVLSKLKDSLRTPISGEDAGVCVRLLASEVAPEWIRVVKVGAREMVVVTVVGQPSCAVVKERVVKMLG
ncbi:hypothetical protein QBC40DRAFT_288780 [Triangularia verruculosa]|uniref:DNA replication factor Cdt1 C-terminal domain-containing protein n=1 Tax=Triangularia verruculosa TaxID=2587418 RepID=A0AAN6XD70_9PEZI|nr:hypothetical protein QBC40DRAFT_288780 [Triangularia verruculosa]